MVASPEPKEGLQRDPQRGLNKHFDRMFTEELVQWVSRLPKYPKKYEFPNGKHPDPRNNLVGLAMSGGGMRSACFNLGVAQALAQYDLMEQVDYLSTVSGGGYLGTSLTALCADDLRYNAVQQIDARKKDDKEPRYPPRLGMKKDRFPYGFPNPLGASSLMDGDKPHTIVHGLESPATRHVREHSDLIARSPGLFDAETWAGATVYAVSTFLLWALFLLPQVTALFLLTMLIPDSVWSRSNPFWDGWLSENLWVFMLPAMLGGTVAALSLIPAREYHEDERTRRNLARLAHRLAIRLLLIIMGATGGVVLFILGLWVHILVVSRSGDWLQVGLTTLLAGGAASAFGSLRMLLIVPESARRTFLKIVYGVSGYYVLGLGLVAWYYLLWNGWEILGWGGLSSLGLHYGVAWAVVLALIAITWVWGHWLLNLFSLNSLYERRIQRTWGISAVPGKDDDETMPRAFAKWTRVWERPDLTIGSLVQKDAGMPRKWRPTSPYPLVCAALNIPGSTGPKLLNRKSESFVIGPVYSGSALTRWKPTQELKTFREMSLAKAAAISGATFSPNMGVRTNTTLSILTALFNARLGWWVENPRHTSWLRRWILAPPTLYWKEVFGLARHEDAFIYLSDGGHFENLGLYELLRRRCKYIIAVDGTGEAASDEEKLTFSSIGVSLRHARIDFGVLVDIDLRPLMRDPKTGLVKSHFAVGRIRYPTGQGHGNGTPDDDDSGLLVYIKAGRVDDVIPPDLIHYQRAVNPHFPHDPTLDQQFDEAQLESYRELGFLAGRAVARESTGQSLAKRFRSLDARYQELFVHTDLKQPEATGEIGYRAAAVPAASDVHDERAADHHRPDTPQNLPAPNGES